MERCQYNFLIIVVEAVQVAQLVQTSPHVLGLQVLLQPQQQQHQQQQSQQQNQPQPQHCQQQQLEL